MLPILGHPRNTRPPPHISEEEESHHHNNNSSNNIESADPSLKRKLDQGDDNAVVVVQLRSLDSGTSLLPWNGSEKFHHQDGSRTRRKSSNNCEFFSDVDLLDRDDVDDGETTDDLEHGSKRGRGMEEERRRVGFKERLEVWKGCWNKWVLERRRRLCVGGGEERSGSLLHMVEDSSLSSTEEGLVSERRRSLPRSGSW